MVAVFGAIAIFHFATGVHEFVNLTTANSAQRSKEIVLRKAVGSGRKGIMMQFSHRGDGVDRCFGGDRNGAWRFW